MTEAQKKFVALEKKKDEVKKYYEELAEATQTVIKEVGLDGYFQDSEGTVYKMVVPDGRYVAFDKVGYERTRRAGEKSGSLSLKEAKEKGFVVE